MHLMRNGQPCGRHDVHRGQCLSADAWKRSNEDKRARLKRFDDNNRNEVFDHYGGNCAYAELGNCSGAIEIDHTNGCDSVGQRSNDSHGGKLYRKLVRAGFPEDYQAVCRHHNVQKTWLTDKEYRLIMVARSSGNALQLGNTEGTKGHKSPADAVETTRILCPKG
jgi:hypothetical protein